MHAGLENGAQTYMGWKMQEREKGNKKSMERRMSNNFCGSILRSN